MSDYDPGLSDYYLVNTSDGTRKLARPKSSVSAVRFRRARNTRFSLTAKIGIQLLDRDGRTVNLTQGLGVNFFNEENDEPATPPSYGVAGLDQRRSRRVCFTIALTSGKSHLMAAGAKNLTDGVGRREKTRFSLRAVWIRKSAAIDPAKPMLLHAENEETRRFRILSRQDQRRFAGETGHGREGL